MKKFASVDFLSLTIFIVLFTISPMISKYSGCMGGGDTNGCAFGTSRQIVFPVYRTITCMLYNQPGCAPATLLPGWYDSLLNYENAFLITALVALSIGLTKKFT